MKNTLIVKIAFLIAAVAVSGGCSSPSAPSKVPPPAANNTPKSQPPKSAASLPVPATTSQGGSTSPASLNKPPIPVSAVTPQMAVTSSSGATLSSAAPVAQPPVTLPRPVYSYNPEGKRDPFKAYMEAGLVSKTSKNTVFPLLNFPLSDLRLVAVIGISKNRYLAMVQTPDGKGYTVKAGMEIGNNRGKIKEIDHQSISIEEEYTEMSGEKKKRTIVLSLRPPEEGQI
ncbi:MAG: pilus assembly protein PilP [Nitrospirae bacterium]|nr:pilus assembly protein PilP [Nitrospirota bacterium]MBI3604777.1 pilus assembly protein PilP [Nitrospirota bacterium]